MTNLDRDHVFFVDDKPSVCQAVSAILQREGYLVRAFTSPKGCLRTLKQACCDLLITDVKMAEMNGLTLLQRARQIRSELPIIVVTGYADVPMAVQALKSGASDFLEKPLGRDLLLPRIQTVHERSRLAPPSAVLSRIEERILRLIVEGKSNRQIAEMLHRSVRTVEDHRRQLMYRLGVSNVVELMTLVLNHKPP